MARVTAPSPDNGGVLAERWFFRGQPPKLQADLFRRAVAALEAEDRVLATLFERTPRDARAEFPDEHPGLAYGLFETTLVYLIFKSWLDRVDVVWEARYSDKHARRADLFVREPPLYFEAKWWGSMQGKTIAGLRHDVARLREVERADGRYLLTFWWNFDARAKEDADAIEGLPERLGDDDIRPRYYARFRTRVARSPVDSAHFALCVFELL